MAPLIHFYSGEMGTWNFQDKSVDWGTAGMKGYFNGAACADLDNDGNQDIIINCLNAPAVILKNNAPKKNYIAVSFKGEGYEYKRYWRQSICFC